MKSQKTTSRASFLLITFSRLFLGAIFIYASIDKIAFPQDFARVVENYELLPTFVVKPVAIILPWLELILGVLLVAGFLIRKSALIVTVLFTIFIIAIGIRATKGPIDDCGCLGELSILSTSNFAILILRDFIFISIGMLILLLNKKIPGEIQ